MTHEDKKFLKRIKKIRKLKKRNIHDCASFLNLSKEDYLLFEQGDYQLTLPEIELLARYLDVPVDLLFQEEPLNRDQIPLTDIKIQSQFKRLHQKMISAKLVIEGNKNSKTLENLHQLTQIPIESLESYQEGSTPIPINHLLQICDALEISFAEFFQSEFLTLDQSDHPQKTSWQQEYPEVPTLVNDHEEDPYAILLEAIKHIPEKDQAQLAKTLLNQLKAS